MKKIICTLLVVLVILSCMTACSFVQNMSGTIADNAASTLKAEEMMAALADDNASDAKALLHPQVAETSDNAITQMSSYLDGREVSAMELKSINVNASAGTAGKSIQEQASYQVTLTDGAVIFLNVVYLSNDQGDGFTSFQVVLGVV